MSIKVIIMDVDGTLTNSQKIVTPKTKEALMKAQKAGAILILASGRPTSGLRDLAAELEMDKHHGLLVAFNGSKVIDCETGETLFNQAMSVEEGKAVLEHMKKFDVMPMMCLRECWKIMAIQLTSFNMNLAVVNLNYVSKKI